MQTARGTTLSFFSKRRARIPKLRPDPKKVLE
jgi:hypothetical protein